MVYDDPVESHEALRFLEQYTRDREDRVTRSLEEYLALFPAFPHVIRREFAALHDATVTAQPPRKRAVEIWPEYTKAHYNLSLVLDKDGDADGAIAAARKAIASKPDHADAYCILGNALRRRGDADGAVAAYAKAIELMTGDAGAH